jgi:predicted nucleic acid-binding Zn ribbon protein
MALQKGEIYRCSECGCEIQVLQGVQSGRGGELSPRCCCGQEMKKVQ